MNSLASFSLSPLLAMIDSAAPSADALAGSLALDGLGLFALVAVIIVTVIGLWGHAGRPGLLGYSLLSLLLIGAVFLMVSATNLLIFYLLWEAVTVISWGISRRATLHSYPALGPLPVQGAGGLASICMLSAVMVLAVENNTLSLGPLSTSGVTLVTVLVLAAVLLKTYGLLSLTWLPGQPRFSAISSALLVGGATVAVGFYPYVRFYWTLLGSSQGFRDLALPVTIAIALVAALIALGERDSHRLLSYAVLSQFSWFMAAVVFFSPEQAGFIFISLLTCLLALSGLYIVLGMVEGITGERDIRRLSGVIKAAPRISALFILFTLAVVGLPPFGGFVARMAVELPVLAEGETTVATLLFGITILTLLYLLRMFGAVFLGELREPLTVKGRASEYLAISTLIVILLFIGLFSPTVIDWSQISFAMPLG